MSVNFQVMISDPSMAFGLPYYFVATSTFMRKNLVIFTDPSCTTLVGGVSDETENLNAEQTI